jgi:hypothetical protein
MILILKRCVGIKGSHEDRNKIKITTYILTLKNNFQEHDFY